MVNKFAITFQKEVTKAMQHEARTSMSPLCTLQVHTSFWPVSDSAVTGRSMLSRKASLCTKTGGSSSGYQAFFKSYTLTTTVSRTRVNVIKRYQPRVFHPFSMIYSACIIARVKDPRSPCPTSIISSICTPCEVILHNGIARWLWGHEGSCGNALCSDFAV